jgi:membrane protein implicated in regulation of membrane protease activity
MIISALSVRHGYPFGFLVRNEGAAGRSHVDTPHAIADVIFWAYLGLMVLVVVSLLRRVRKTQQAPEQPAEQEERQYIEHRGHAGEQAHQKTVGPLP